MSTSSSPPAQLRAQAKKIAALLHKAERGEEVPGPFALKVLEARNKPSINVAVVMDDKVIKIDIAWQTIRETGELGLTEYILNQMRGHTPTVN